MIKLLERIVLRLNLIEAKKTKACPTPTRDVNLNLKNRNKAIKQQAYGPANPSLPNKKFWKEKAEMWDNIPVSEAKSMRCGNCAAFDISKKMKKCIQDGLKDDAQTDSYDTVNAGQLGYCHMLKFKCAAKRTCDAWVTGGPIREMNEGIFGSRDPELDTPEPELEPEEDLEQWNVTLSYSIWKTPQSEFVEDKFDVYWMSDNWNTLREIPMSKINQYKNSNIASFPSLDQALEYVKIKSGQEIPSAVAGDPRARGAAKPTKLSGEGRRWMFDLEGVRRQVYDDKTGETISSWEELNRPGKKPGKPTIAAGRRIWPNEYHIFEKYLGGRQSLTDSELEYWVNEPILTREPQLNSLLTGPTNQGQYDALFSFLYNCGQDSQDVKKAIRLHNEGKYADAALAIQNGPWHDDGEFKQGLKDRREKEALHYRKASGLVK